VPCRTSRFLILGNIASYRVTIGMRDLASKVNSCRVLSILHGWFETVVERRSDQLAFYWPTAAEAVILVAMWRRSHVTAGRAGGQNMSSKEASLSEWVHTSFKQLSVAATNLNAVSDELGKSIAVLDSALKKLGKGCAQGCALDIPA